MVKMIDNYTLLQIIGEGNFGKVYRAKHIRNSTQYAIKIIPADKLHQNTKLEECTMNEVQTLAQIGQTDHIIIYYQMLKTKNNYYFVYQFCNGGTLMELLAKEHHLQEVKSLSIFTQLLQAFKVLNKLNIMHRDLKPENIFFSDNKIKLGDFGFCKGLRPQQNMTKTMLGSPIYMAPQVLKGEAYNTKADIWSLGVILYEMLYGECPFQSSSIAMLINTINSNDIVLPSHIKVSEKTKELIKRLLTKDVYRRIGWIQLFSWFGQQLTQQKQNIFQNHLQSNPRPSFQKKSSLVEQWASKNKISQISVKQRSISQDIAKRDHRKFQLGSLDNISPSHFNQRNMYTPKIGQQKSDTDTNKNAGFVNQHKSYSAIRQPSDSSYQPYQRKPASLPKRQMIAINSQSSYGNSNYKPESTKKIFYSQNYQNVFQTPINSKNQNKNTELASEKTLEKSIEYNEEFGFKQKNPQRSSINKHSIVLIGSRANWSSINSKSIKQIKSEISRSKRRELLTIHQQCLVILKITFSKLQEKRQRFFKVAFLVLKMVLQRLKEITRLIQITELDLLDIASLVNYEIIQVDRTLVDLKEQMDTNFETIPDKLEDIMDELDDGSQDNKLKLFVCKKQNEPDLEKNIPILQALLQAEVIQSASFNNIILNVEDGSSNISNNNSKYKATYHTTNGFAEYYKNLIESKERNTTTKIALNS